MSQTLEQLTKDAIEELEDWVESNPGEDATDSAISEIADSSVPIYTGDILAVAASNYFLATDEPEIGPAFDGSPTPTNIIAANIYEHIYQALYERWYELEKERADAEVEDE
jgi:hypothetical protein